MGLMGTGETGEERERLMRSSGIFENDCYVYESS